MEIYKLVYVLDILYAKCDSLLSYMLSNTLLYTLFSESLQNRFLYSKRICKFEEML